MYRVGVDIGGTFTDVVVVADGGRVVRSKALTTPGDYAEGVAAAVENAAQVLDTTVSGLLSECDSFVNATTVVTNVIAQERGRRVGLLTTRGFRQQLYIHRGVRQLELDLQQDLRPPDMVSLRHVVEVDERVDRRGDVLVPLDEAAVERDVRRLVEEDGVEALAVCLLWSFRNPDHERRIGEIVAEAYPDLFVTLSCEIYPRIREYERMNTTVLNSFVSEGAETYIGNLTKRLTESGMDPRRISFMQSLGGHISAADAMREPIRLSHSGPVGGVVAASHFAEELGEQHVITADLGGTSFDTALVRDGRLTYAHRTKINRLLTGLSIVDIHAIGAGGGSIGWIDGRGIPQVGPRSAGSDPGPACYSRGGALPTITDANLLLGMIDPDNFWGGALELDVAAAELALQPLADSLGKSLTETAAGLHEIAVTHMSTAIAKVSIERGYDPREFTVVGYGGAAGLFLAEVCQQLGVKRLLMPRAAATFSAYGLLFADATRAYATTAEWDPAGGALEDVNAIYEGLERRARDALVAEGHADASISVVREADIKWAGQSFEIPVMMPSRPLEEADRATIAASFQSEYERLYGAGTAWEGSPIELHTARVVSLAETTKPELPRSPVGPAASDAARSGVRSIHLADGTVEAATFSGQLLTSGMAVSGPALVDDVDTTLYVPDGVSLSIDDLDNYVFALHAATANGGPR